jgi:hypothetical protein
MILRRIASNPRRISAKPALNMPDRGLQKGHPMTGFVFRRLEPNAAAILDAYANGASVEDLAAQCGCAAGTMRRFLLGHDVVVRPVPRKRKLDRYRAEVMEAVGAGTDIVSIALRFRVKPQTVRNFVTYAVSPE